MKKLISFVMAAAMVASLVPATAFAAQEDVKATAKVVGVVKTDGNRTDFTAGSGDIPEVQITIDSAAYAVADVNPAADITITLDNAEWDNTAAGYQVGADLKAGGHITVGAGHINGLTVVSVDEDELVVRVTGRLQEDDKLIFPLLSTVDKASKNATVSVESDDITVALADATYVVSSEASFTASVKKTVKVAEEEFVTLEDVKIKEVVDGSLVDNAAITLKLSKGFEFDDSAAALGLITGIDNIVVDGNTMDAQVNNAAGGNFDIENLKIEATNAKAGATGTLTITIGNMDKVVVDVVEVVDYKVVMSVDEDEDVPVMYSGVDMDNTGITDTSDHKTLDITLEETFPGAWSMRQGFNITLPEGVYVTEVEVVDADNFWQAGAVLADGGVAAWEQAFWDAYRDGDYEGFEFGKRTFDDVNTNTPDVNECATVTFALTVVADPGFEGDVEVGFEGALVDTQSVVAAKFVAPYTVKAEQNDVKIDSRYTSVDTPITITEAADGLWEKDDATFFFTIETGAITFEDTADFTADNDMVLKNDGLTRNNQLAFTVKTESDKAATVTIDSMELFLERNIPEGPYDLLIDSTLERNYNGDVLFAAEEAGNVYRATNAAIVAALPGAIDQDADNFVGNVNDYSDVAKEAFINVITAPRDEDGFTTKISVPVGESYIIAGEKKVEIDTPAYINANGYTMLPLRAVAVALGVDNNSVIWDQATRTATILYGNRIVSMQNGANVMYINAQAVPTKAGVEITNNRTFLSLRDLGTAMNVTDITWDAATRTAYLNAGVEA